MSVVINEFEVVPEAATPASQGQQPAAAPQPPAPSPRELIEALRREAERAARLRAY
jgi:hypothetical protein